MEAVICRHFKFGYCKFGARCQFKHVNQECENSSCDISSCDKRHPIICRFYSNFGRCKFSPCSYKHESRPSIGALENKLNDIENEVKQKDLEIQELKRTIDNLHQTIQGVQSIVTWYRFSYWFFGWKPRNKLEDCVIWKSTGKLLSTFGSVYSHRKIEEQRRI